MNSVASAGANDDAGVQPSREVAGEAFLDPTGKIVNVSLTRGYLGVPPESASLGCKVVPVRIVVNADGVDPGASSDGGNSDGK
jgi:hypothetical protein